MNRDPKPSERPAGMKILLACQKSGYLRQLLRDMGHDAWTCDIELAEDDDPETNWRAHHIQDDAILVAYGRKWDAMIAMPECRYLSSSGQHRTGKPGRRTVDDVEEAARFFRALVGAPIFHKCIENSIGIMSTRYRKPDQIVQPWMFGDDASKNTCLWLESFPHLIINPQKFVAPRLVRVNGKTYKRWSNQTDSGQNRLGPSPTRSADRARTFPGIARALAVAVSRIAKEQNANQS